MNRALPPMRNDSAMRRFFNGPLPWLAYLPFYVLPWLWTPPTHASVVVSLVALVIFLPLYLSRAWATGWGLFAVACLVMVLAVLLAPWGGNWTVFAIYAGAMAGALRPARLAGWTIFGFALMTGAVGLTLSHPLIWWMPGILLIGTTGFGVMSREAVLDRNAALLAAQEEVRRLSQTAERERITRDLHDVVGRTLTLVALKSDIAARLCADDSQAAAQEMRSVAVAAREGLTELRAALAGMAGGSLARESEVSLSALAAAGVAATLDGDPGSVTPEAGAVLAMTLREAVTNVIRHAGARECRMTISTLDGMARLTVEDDGRGGSFTEGTGLAGMRQRLIAAGGSLSLDRAERGTRLAASVPVSAA